MTNVYKKVYFRINTPSYYNPTSGVGFSNDSDKETFYNAITELFMNDGWTVKQEKYFKGSRLIKEGQELQLHPQSISGVALEEDITDIENLLMKCEVFSFRVTDIYENVYDLTDEEYIGKFESKKNEITCDILEAFKTKRKNLFITDSYTVLSNVLNKYRIKRLSHYIGVYTSSDIDIKWFEDLLNSIIDEGRITTAKTRNGTGYRTLNQDEMKHWKTRNINADVLV